MATTEGRTQGTRTAVWPEDVPWDDALASSPAIRAGEWVFTSAHLPTDYRSALAATAAVDPHAPYAQSEVELETRYVLDSLARTLAAADSDLRTDGLRMHWWLRSDRPTLDEFLAGNNWSGFEDLTPIHEERERTIDQPAPGSTGIGVRGLLADAATISSAVIAATKPKQGVPAPPEMAPIPDDPAVRVGDWVFTVGVIASDWQGDFGSDRHMGTRSAVDPKARVNPYLWFGSDVEAQVEAILETLAGIAESAGTSLERCVKAEVYFGHPRDLYAIERAWRRAFPRRPPARTLVPYSGIGAVGCRVEIALTLLAGDAPITTVEATAVPEPVWHEPQAIHAGDLLFLSNRLALDERGHVPAALTEDGGFRHLHEAGRAQAAHILGDISAICEAAGSSLDQLCRRTTFYDGLRHFAGMAAESRPHFPDRTAPASIDIEVGREWPLLVPGARMIVDAIAYAPS